MMREFGLVGYPLSHSFSPTYFKEKFEKEQITDATYKAFSTADLHAFLADVVQNENFVGFNVTIPYKQGIMPLLHSVSDEASYVGAVNTVKRLKNGDLVGYNTDVYGFRESIRPYLKQEHTRALVLGTGGAAQAVHYVLKELGLSSISVSRRKGSGHITYEQLTEEFIQNYPVIVNTTPLGMYPNTNECPAIPYQAITNQHFCYDLIYNPEETLFLKKARKQGATTLNGLKMLYLQAEQSWKIWNHLL